jgi:hypothetical protein
VVMAMRFVQGPRARLLRRFLSMFHADREHLHHLLAHFGARRSHVVALLYSVVLAFCGMALLVAVTGKSSLGGLLLLLEFAVIFGMRQIGRATRPPAPPTPASPEPPRVAVREVAPGRGRSGRVTGSLHTIKAP